MLNKNAIIKALAIFVLIIILISIIYIFMMNNNGNRYGDQLTIANLDEYTKDKPTDKDAIDHIQFALLQTINSNLNKPVGNNSIDDILIRSGSFKQSKEEKTGIHSVEFIVDSESLKQSYMITYQWADNENVDLPEWGTAVKCLPEDKIIYKDFKCKDMFKEMSENIDESLSKVLPYNGDYYRISQYPDGDNTNISIQIMINNNSTRTKERFEEYKEDALEWLKSNGVNVDKYRIDYRNLSNDLISIKPRIEL